MTQSTQSAASGSLLLPLHDALPISAVDGLGGLDVLVNNAAAITLHPLPETSYADWQAAWQRTIGVNVLGSANVSYCAARSEAHTSELQSRSQLVCRHLLYNNTTHTS